MSPAWLARSLERGTVCRIGDMYAIVGGYKISCRQRSAGTVVT